jgi:predicted transcriptional regulator
MRKIPRRDRLKIYGDLLAVLNAEARNERIVLSHIQIQMNVPFDRLKIYIVELKGLELIDNEDSLKLTEKGREYLREYKKVLEFIKRMGLAYR